MTDVVFTDISYPYYPLVGSPVSRTRYYGRPASRSRYVEPPLFHPRYPTGTRCRSAGTYGGRVHVHHDYPPYTVRAPSVPIVTSYRRPYSARQIGPSRVYLGDIII
mmetsp:Transcript_11354/g.34202  ORF Transcript_11354/g.34202 Transcript_11354/m.34202 type:complete len:106 (+) Transcript_11354:106-423(+)